MRLRFLKHILFVTVALLTAGCAAKKMKPARFPQFMVAVDSEGYLRLTNGSRLKDEKRDIIEDHFNVIFKNPELQKQTNILLFIQGGLNGLNDAVAALRRLAGSRLTTEGVLVITARRFRRTDYVEMLVELVPELPVTEDGALRSTRLPSLKHVVYLGTDGTPGGIAWTRFLEGAERVTSAELSAHEALLQFDDPVNIQYTSGTTGAPKGATLSHHNILNNGFFVGEMLKYTAEDRICVPVPFYHCFGCVMGNLAAVTHGAAVIIPAESFDAEATLDAIERHHCTSIYGVPTIRDLSQGLAQTKGAV